MLYQQEVHEATSAALKDAGKTIKTLKEEKVELEVKVTELEYKLKESEEMKISTRIDGKRINPKLKAASMYLQNLGLAETNVSEAIKLVVEGVTSSQLTGPLPSTSTQARIGSEMKA